MASTWAAATASKHATPASPDDMFSPRAYLTESLSGLPTRTKPLARRTLPRGEPISFGRC